jgi:hypothetical protein
MLRVLAIWILVGGVTWAAAEVPPPEPRQPADKTGYTLLNPTPREFLREMSTDRPDRTESPYTVDAGRMQVETDVLNYSYDRYNSARDHTRVETVAIAPFNLKIGLCNSTDFQVVVPTYTSIRTHDTAARRVRHDRGFGDLITRVKVNFWGNDGGDTALGVIPFVKWPTSSGGVGNNSVEGGVILPLAVALPHGWDMGTMVETDFNCDNDGSGHHAEVITSITVSHSIAGQLSGYVEFFNNLSTEHRGTPWIATADFGVTYRLTEDIQLDAGINIGLTRAADDMNPFVGISVRF